MHKRGIEKFKFYHVGINSLAQIATREDRVCVLNILGNESRAVTPTSHVYSGGNVVFGTSPGRSGQVLATKMGDIPVFHNVSEGMDAGHAFNTAVIYMPPTGVRDAVAEVSRVNPDNLKKVVILTEKVPVKDARTIRALGQMRGFDIFGANTLGLADAHNKVRIGGALGGTHPDESLIPGSVAIFSNSGNFTTTIAVYLLSQGWGTTCSLSSGKDVYIHFAAAEFTNAFENDPRSKAAVYYIEPGGYYEAGLEFKKPAVTCVVGRWKAQLTKAVGHAGSLAGSGDDAKAKERWFMDYFGVDDIYTPDNPVFSKKGAVVINISHVPEALSRVMELNGIQPDFDPIGDLSKKAWFGGNQGLVLPPHLDVAVISAIAPYCDQIEAINSKLGATFPRQNLKDASGATRMHPKTQVTQVHGVTVLQAASRSMEENLVMALTREYPPKAGARMVGMLLGAEVNLFGNPALDSVRASRSAGNSPNTVVAAAISLIGGKKVEQARKAVGELIKAFEDGNISDPFSDRVELGERFRRVDKAPFLTDEPDGRAEMLLKAIEGLEQRSLFVDFVTELAERENRKVSFDGLTAAVAATVAWPAYRQKKISGVTLYNMPWYFKLYGTLVGAGADPDKHSREAFAGVPNEELISSWNFGETSFLALFGRKPTEEELFDFNVIIGLVISNGPGTISAQGAKGAVSADGPEEPRRVQINKGFLGFLTHTGFAHGGNGYEAIEFLLERFKGTGLTDPGDENHGLDLKTMAMDFAKGYKSYKKEQKEIGNISYKKIPCVNHPVFKGKEINYDPREVHVSELFGKRGNYNVFLDFYHELVKALFKVGASQNIYCVNVDAVIAVIILKLLWVPFNNGEFSENNLEEAAFTIFLFGRMIGSAAEIEDHINRGRNMDMRTPASRCSFVE